jgi:hypothetical protein
VVAVLPAPLVTGALVPVAVAGAYAITAAIAWRTRLS